jgi:hypothetical protein
VWAREAQPFLGGYDMREDAVIEAARELVRAEESEAMASRHADASSRRSAMERRAIALAKLKEAVAAYDARSATSDRTEGSRAPSDDAGRA